MIRFRAFSELTSAELYDILALRQRVFIVEQHCFYLDSDHRDQECIHVTMHDGDRLAGYARLLPPGLYYETAGVGRLVLDKAYRGQGMGEKLLAACIEKCLALYGSDITITAQCVSIEFYKKCGFLSKSEPFDEAGIPHIKMVFPAKIPAKPLTLRAESA